MALPSRPASHCFSHLRARQPELAFLPLLLLCLVLARPATGVKWLHDWHCVCISSQLLPLLLLLLIDNASGVGSGGGRLMAPTTLATGNNKQTVAEAEGGRGRQQAAGGKRTKNKLR